MDAYDSEHTDATQVVDDLIAFRHGCSFPVRKVLLLAYILYSIPAVMAKLLRVMKNGLRRARFSAKEKLLNNS